MITMKNVCHNLNNLLNSLIVAELAAEVLEWAN